MKNNPHLATLLISVMSNSVDCKIRERYLNAECSYLKSLLAGETEFSEKLRFPDAKKDIVLKFDDEGDTMAMIYEMNSDSLKERYNLCCRGISTEVLNLVEPYMPTFFEKVAKNIQENQNKKTSAVQVKEGTIQHFFVIAGK